MELNKDETIINLYKYMSLDGFRKMISCSSLLFSNPLKYNDPFDTQGYISCDSTLKERNLFWLKEGKSEIEAAKMSNINDDIIEDYANEVYKKMRSQLKICCFSCSSENILMWSHYAEQHKGVCVRFDPLQDDIFKDAKKVSYKDSLPVWHLFKNDLNEVGNIIYTKATDWAYEKEIRIAKHQSQQSKNKIKFNKGALKEIIFGCNFPENKMRGIKTIVESAGYNVIFKKAETTQQQYGLSITNLDI